jgi:hypothetical protein
MIPKDKRDTAAAWARIETTKEDGRWLSSGRSEKSEMVREYFIPGPMPSHALFRLLSFGWFVRLHL